jgi:hypothetical protein
VPFIQPINAAQLPAIVCGPIVRRLTRTRVHVWVALSTGDPIQLTVFDAANNATAGAAVVPTRIGQSLWLAVLAVDGVTGGSFASGSTYEYTVSSAAWPAGRAPNWADFALPGRNRPSFVGLPAQLTNLRILHTSCRRPHANKRDALALALPELQGANRPHLLILSGDQVYADDVGTLTAARLRSIDTDLVGIDDSPVFGAVPPLAGRRAATLAMGLTSDEAINHVWTLGEFYGLYLLAWSDALWTQPLPAFGAAAPNEVDPAFTQQMFDDEVANLTLFLTVLRDVRKVLANVSTLMIFDDHEITDDWNLNHGWLRTVYGNAMGRRLVANGLLAYLLFQHWGNVSDVFAVAGSEEQQALAAATFVAPGAGLAASPINGALETRLGLPGNLAAPVPNPVPAAGYAVRDLQTGIRYDLQLGPNEGYPLRIVILDERTARFVGEDDAPCGRIAAVALDREWPAPQGNEADTPTLLVAPAPVLGLHLIEHVIQPLLGLTQGGAQTFDFESWSALGSTFENLLARISAWRRVVILSGDVHFGYAAGLRYESPPGAAQPGRAVQFVASGAKNTATLTLLLHLLGDALMKSGVIRTRTFRGYAQLTAQQRNALASAPAGTLVYDDAADIALGRVLREGQRQPAVFPEDIAVYYNLGAADWRYTINHIDDESLPGAGNLAAALAAAPAAAWAGWNRANSIATVRALRASDLVRIGRVIVGLPQLAVISFASAQPLQPRQDLRIMQGQVNPGPVVTSTMSADLG